MPSGRTVLVAATSNGKPVAVSGVNVTFTLLVSPRVNPPLPPRESKLSTLIDASPPTVFWRSTANSISTWPTGDVFARAYVRWLEIQSSVAFIQEQLAAIADGPIAAEVGPLNPDHLAVSLVEGWRGEICHGGGQRRPRRRDVCLYRCPELSSDCLLQGSGNVSLFP